MPKFENRYPDNAPGKYYVDCQCLDCDVCRDIVPTVFTRNDEGGYSYVYKQPETAEEIKACEEAVEACHTEAIGNDGDLFDWNTPLVDFLKRANELRVENPSSQTADKKKCCHCEQPKKPWWKFW